ncbi:fungal-specific transcription factor domain-containing protein [Aspergillus caelatus]|uniref:Fungal-specific transcription factor domain-containing protein n=1 Tax=Aspergillus caelatus TaxID=61420 RepID=A0A5N7A1C2_9EURO|nr:fungal-specific transcription factor domain-containing protein [Aspergillus caelatus]KAE8362999.1 fungal-specific transcription factor domain-containing protein [Aspergillus caelatus]
MAMHSTPLLTTLIPWSSSHLPLRDHSFDQVAMQNRCTALRDLRVTLESDPSNVEANLAMTLVLCSIESIMADNGDAWYLHLVGAAGVISSQLAVEDGSNVSSVDRILQKFEDAHAGRWLLRNFAYRDIMMAVARDRAPLLESHQFLRLDETQMPDSHFGLASEILEILFHTATLNQEVKASNEPASLDCDNDDGIASVNTVGSAQRPEFLERLLSLETRLKDWTCPPSPDPSLRQLAESYHSSALIYLYRVMRRAFPMQRDELSSKATTQVASVVDSISQIPMRSLPECTLLFPLFFAGGEATAESHMESIRHRMLDIIESRGFRNVVVALFVT